MKTRLTREESLHLIKLGVPKELASGEMTVQPIGGGIKGIVPAPRYPIFKLEDLLNGEILPKWINTPEDRYSFAIQITEKGKWIVGFRRVAVWKTYCKYEELIDALYQLACKYYGEYLKSEKK